MNHTPCRGPSVNQTNFISHISSYLIISLGEPPLYPHLIEPNLPAFENFEDFRAYAPTADPRGSSDVTYFPASVPRRPLGQAVSLMEYLPLLMDMITSSTVKWGYVWVCYMDNYDSDDTMR